MRNGMNLRIGVLVLILLIIAPVLHAQVKKVKTLKILVAEDAIFLKKNKTQPGIVETTSGLQYKIVKAGTGEKPLKFSRVRINYTLNDFQGKIFASNGNKIWEHRMDKALAGMEEALRMMPAGSKWILYMPAKLCESKYEKVGGGRALQCTLELISVK